MAFVASSMNSPTGKHIIPRLGTGLFGGYLFTWGFITFGVALLLKAGMDFDDARACVFLLAFLIYLAVLCWAFVAANLLRVAIVLFGAGAAMTGAAWFLLPA